MASSREPYNPFYLLLLLASLLFVLTALAYALVPTLEDKARLAGQLVPPSPWRQALREDGWRWLLYEVAAMILFGLLSMGLDRLRSWQQKRAPGTMDSPEDASSPVTEAAARHHDH
jgi:hypothetical protein